MGGPIGEYLGETETGCKVELHPTRVTIPSLRLAEGERGVPKARRSCAFWGVGMKDRLRCCIRINKSFTVREEKIAETFRANPREAKPQHDPHPRLFIVRDVRIDRLLCIVLA